MGSNPKSLEMIKLGRCAKCWVKQKEERKGKWYCEKCQEYFNQYKRKYRKAFREAGKCDMCGKDPVPGKTRCEKHLKYFRDWARNKSNV